MGRNQHGWFGGALVLKGRDKEFLKVPKGLSFDQRAAYARRWSELTVNPSREIVLILPSDDGLSTRCIASSERLEGPIAPRETVETPTLVWIEKRSGQYRLVVFENDEARTVLTRSHVLRSPHIAKTANGFVLAFESDTGPATTQVEVVNHQGMTLYQIAGREPRLCAAAGGMVLCTEQPTPDEVILRLDFFDRLRKEREPALQRWGPPTSSALRHGGSAEKIPANTVRLQEGDYLLNANIAWSEENQTLSVAAESSPRWGYSNQIGLERTIHVWEWDLRGNPVSFGELPVERRAFKTLGFGGKTLGVENLPPICPSVFVEDGTPVVAFKQYRYTGARAFEWDIFMCRLEENGWTEPARISDKPTLPDSSFGLVYKDGEYVALIPTHSCEGGHGNRQSENHQIDLVRFTPDFRMERIEVPNENRGDYRLPPSCKDVAPEPPALVSPYEGRQLVWGDLHMHSMYSKCVGAVDGSPRDNIRFAREVLGCRVFAIAEHTPFTTGIESTWVFDQLESTAGEDNVVLYATEPGQHGTRDINYYCRTRASFERLERIILSHNIQHHDMVRHFREDFEADELFLIRHFHGNPIPDERIRQHFDPHFEPAMEAMQGRGNAMMQNLENRSQFPNAFLDAGCKIGLVGGTDHFRENAPNHFCLTGFWVKEVTPDGVWEAIRNRFTFAMSDSRVAMVTRCKGAPMGETAVLNADEAFTVSVEASCAHSIRRVTLMRDGELLPWTDIGGKRITIELEDAECPPGAHWYVVTVEVETGFGADNEGLCQASPYFVWKKPS